MLYLDEYQKASDFMDQFKLAIVAIDPVKNTRMMFPHWFTEELVVEQVRADETLEDTTGEWKFTDPVSPQDAEQVMKDMLQNGQGRITMADVE